MLEVVWKTVVWKTVESKGKKPINALTRKDWTAKFWRNKAEQEGRQGENMTSENLLTYEICKVGSHQPHSFLCNEHVLTALILLELPVNWEFNDSQYTLSNI